mgnify:FL=1
MTEKDIAPDCPICGSKMIERTAKRGARKGKNFWGCSEWSKTKCGGIIDISDEMNSEKDQSDYKSRKIKKVTKSQPVKWTDEILRQGWYTEYISIGAFPSFLSHKFIDNNKDLTKILNQAIIYENKNRERSSKKDNIIIGNILNKILQRGYLPFCSYGIEKEAIKAFKLKDQVIESNDKGDISYKLKDKFDLEDSSIIYELTKKDNFNLDEELDFVGDGSLFNSHLEQKFFKEWIPKNLTIHDDQDKICNWFIPQPNLDRILRANGFETKASRRLDFLFSHPFGIFGIEIDGGEHNPELDQERDDALISCGIEVIRIKNKEIEDSEGPNLEKIKNKFNQIFKDKHKELEENEINLIKSIEEISFASKLQFSLARAIKYGWLESDEWIIEVRGLKELAVTSIIDFCKMMKGLKCLFDLSAIPKKISVITEEGLFEISVDKETSKKISSNKKIIPNLKVKLDKRASSFHEIIGESSEENEDIIIRPTFLPVDLTITDKYSGKRISLVEENKEKIETSLVIFLQNIFRKKEFREAQVDSISTILANLDTVILLPTGAGKSLIYQLSGLLMPGVTLIIDPIVALMDDQKESLYQYGIDRVVALSGKSLNKRKDIERIQSGEFQFIFLTPERLQMPEERQALRGLATTSLINLSVVDEAHCVSEWGHEFRPAYLNVSRNIRRFGMDRDKKPPPITALTGTASRSVLRDVLTDLEIDSDNPKSVIRPSSFDRSELNFFVMKADGPSYSRTTLSSTITSLHERFNIPESEFFKPNGDNTYSGIVFVPYVGKNPSVSHTIKNTQEIVEKASETQATIYSGSAPAGEDVFNWGEKKSKNVKDFKYNKIPILVSTKAYGMGIDKPNIRYTLHYGIPSSVEMFYQEAGRAGRNRKDSYCGIIFSEYSERRTNELLDPSSDLEELRKKFQNHKSFSERDDLNRQLFFHLNSFSGENIELSSIKKVIDKIEDINIDHTFEISFNEKNRNEIETALLRLTRLGIFKDYEIEYGSSKILIHTNELNIKNSKDNLLDYVNLTAPGRTKKFEIELNNIKNENNKENIIKLCEVLINFTYDIIERARRSALREMVLLARNSKDDLSIRNRILDYLTEGVGAEQIQILLQEKDVSLKEWKEKINIINTPIDASELRGISMRALDASPDHPGLLLIRSITELLCSENDITVSVQDLYASIKNSKDRYLLDEKEWVDSLSWLMSLSRGGKNNISLMVGIVFLRAIRDNLFSNSSSEEVLQFFSNQDNPEINSVKNVFDISSATDNLNLSVKNLTNVLGDKELISSLGG